MEPTNWLLSYLYPYPYLEEGTVPLAIGTKEQMAELKDMLLPLIVEDGAGLSLAEVSVNPTSSRIVATFSNFFCNREGDHLPFIQRVIEDYEEVYTVHSKNPREKEEDEWREHEEKEKIRNEALKQFHRHF